MICVAAIQFKVFDAVKAATKALHLHALVDNRACAAIARHAELINTPKIWMERAAVDVREELYPYGVTLERLDLTQHGTGVAVKNLNDSNFSDWTNGKSPYLEN